MKKKIVRPTESELEVLKVLWEDGPCTVRHINDRINLKKDKKKRGYTTTLKIMQIMFEKGLLSRNEENRSHVYQALVTKEGTQTLLLERFLNSAFAGSAGNLVLNALGRHRPSKEEISSIRKLLDELEER